MKKSLLIIFAVVLSISFSLSQSWRKAVTATYPSINDVCFISENEGWIVGSAGAIYKSIDGGLTWSEQNSGISVSLSSVYFLNAQQGFIGGANRYFLSTVDGGNTWAVDSIEAIPNASASIRSVYFADNLRGWVMASTSSAGWVARTTDGGATWLLDLDFSGGDLEAMSFYGASNGIVTGGGVGKVDLFYTIDGATWTKAPVPAFPPVYTRSDIRGVYMVDANTAYTCGWGSMIGLQPSIYLKTTDGGATWEYLTQAEENRTYDNVNSIWFKDSNNGISVGGATRGSVVTRTTDGGVNWIPIRAPFGATLQSVTGIGNKIWIVGNGGLIATSSDFGDSWQLITPIPSGTLYRIQFSGAGTGFAAGFDGVFLKTTNGGQDWMGGYLTAGLRTINIQDIYFVNENVGYAAHSYRMVAKTTNGGTDWFAVIADTMSPTTTSYGVHFVDENYGFVVGRIASGVDIIYKTTDGGSTWSTKTGLVGKDLRGVEFVNQNRGAIVGDGLNTIYTNDGGETWTPATFSDVPSELQTANIRSITFLDENTAVAVGDKIILKSVNGGAEWKFIQTGSNILLNTVHFHDQNAGYAVGQGEVWKTIDAGETWTNIHDNDVITGNLYGVTTDQAGDVWITSSGSNIFTNKEPSGIIDNYIGMSDFSLNQNYPNPFNPSTTIEFEINKGSNVTLEVFDLLGRKAAVLVNEYKAPGSYKANFNAGNLASGIYLYVLKANGKIMSGKMTLLK
jgi:photosystem II stability/assembly factor-like uncharacterized protein